MTLIKEYNSDGTVTENIERHPTYPQFFFSGELLFNDNVHSQTVDIGVTQNLHVLSKNYY